MSPISAEHGSSQREVPSIYQCPLFPQDMAASKDMYFPLCQCPLIPNDMAANKEMAGLKRRIRGGRNTDSNIDPGGVKTGCKKSCGAAQLDRLSLYDDKEGPEKNPEQGGPGEDARALKGIFRSLKDSVTAPNKSLCVGRAHELEGIFQKLTDPEQFRRTVMPGLQEDERKDAPSSLQELLRTSLYSAAVEASLPRVVERAASVLEAVKERGRKSGEIMDAATEEVLKPQVLQEAFAREVINVVSTVNAAAKAKAAKERGKLASPSCEQAGWDQLDSDTVLGLLEKGKGFAVQDSFLGEEWVSVLLEDSVRFQGTGKLGLRGVDPEYGEMAWVEPAQLEFGYPALHELVVNVHALAFELNLKDPRLRLSHPFHGSTMLLRLTEGCRFPERLDSFVDSAETGYQVSAAYFVGRRCRQETTPTPPNESQGVPKGGGELKLKNIEKASIAGASACDSGSRTGEKGDGSTPRRKASGGQEETGAEGGGGGRDGDGVGGGASSVSTGPREEEEGVTAGQSVMVEAKADRLVLFRSDRVSTQTLEVLGRGQEQYMLLFWMHGAK
ncbi:unnamed protein product, partial [Laminaria digitata]